MRTWQALYLAYTCISSSGREVQLQGFFPHSVLGLVQAQPSPEESSFRPSLWNSCAYTPDTGQSHMVSDILPTGPHTVFRKQGFFVDDAKCSVGRENEPDYENFCQSSNCIMCVQQYEIRGKYN